MALRNSILLCVLLLTHLGVSNGLNCFRCDSDSDETCATGTSLTLNETAVDCSVDEINCAVWIDGVTTHRDCGSNIPADITNLRLCQTDGCNAILFPDKRLQCIQCSANIEDCITPSVELLHPCKNYNETDLCYSYILNNMTAIRGCLSDENENVQLCDVVGEDCVKCDEDFCNSISGIDIIECISCSSDTDPSCGYTQYSGFELIQCSVIYGRENLCVAYRDGQTFIRGCLNDYPDLKEKCDQNSDDCNICDGHECNFGKLIEELCAVCTSESDTECLDLTTSNKTMICGEGTINQSGCYHYDKDGIIERGCVVSLKQDQLSECLDGEVCKICQGSMCNIKQKFQTCYSCNSTDDSNCVTLEQSLMEKVCDDYMDSCKVFVKPNASTHRGCSNEMLEDIYCSDQTTNCHKCEDSFCNGDIFPSNRITCFHCEGTSDDECYRNLTIDRNKNFNSVCHNYNFRDSCYFYIDNEKVVHRGCLSDDDSQTEMCQNDTEKCRTCQSSNCNFDSIMEPQELSCITCDSLVTPACLWGYAIGSADKCTHERYFYETETCYTLHVSNETIIRACTLDGNVCTSTHQCDICLGIACNRDNVAISTCHQCSSDTDENCAMNPQETNAVVCGLNYIVEYENRGCYTWSNVTEVDGKSQHYVARGCFNDLPSDRRRNCQADEDNCDICYGDQCNIDPKSSVGIKTISIFLLIICLLMKFF